MTNRKLSDIVRRQRPVSLPGDATVQEACRLMHKHRIGAMLVTEDGDRLVGVFTGRDAVGRVLAEARNPATTILRDVMTASPDTIAPHARAVEALRAMHDGGYRHLPVVEDGRILGIVSHGDFVGLEHARLDEETGYWEIL